MTLNQTWRQWNVEKIQIFGSRLAKANRPAVKLSDTTIIFFTHGLPIELSIKSLFTRL